MFSEHISTDAVLFLMLYGITGVVPLFAALYLLLRRGNAFAPDVTPPLLLRRRTASFFAVMTLDHVWWMLYYVFSDGFQSMSMSDLPYSKVYYAIAMLDCATMLPTIVGTLLAMLQDRKRPLWPVIAAMVPFVALGGVVLVWPSLQTFYCAVAYVLLLHVCFTIYMVYSVRQYRRWLRDNYADLEHKEVWQTQVIVFFFMLLFFLYTLIDLESLLLIYLLHIFLFVFYVFLLWRVETLPTLDNHNNCSPTPSRKERGASSYTAEKFEPEGNCPPLPERESVGEASDLRKIERLLTEHCVANCLYLQHDLKLQQLALAIGTNRSYLSQYFSRQGITYNTYINNLRINYFISRYKEAVAAGQPIVALQLANESGYRSYSTFSLAFKQRTGQSVTAWMRSNER